MEYMHDITFLFLFIFNSIIFYILGRQYALKQREHLETSNRWLHGENQHLRMAIKD